MKRKGTRATMVQTGAIRRGRDTALAAATVPASTAKTEFGRILELAVRGRTVVITRHDRPTAVLLSLDKYNALSGADAAALDALSREFDSLLSRMQTPVARSGMKRAFAASPRQLGKAAVNAARRRG